MTEPGHLPEAEFQQIEEFISRTPRGRVATPLAWTHLGLQPPVTGFGQTGLFE